MEAYPERLMDDRSLSREAGTGRYQEIEDKRGVSGEGQAKAQSARARRREVDSLWAPSLMAALPYHARSFRSSALVCVNLRRVFRELLSRTARAFHLD